MENTSRPRNILVDIDAIFDTRLPLLYLLSPTLAGLLTKNKKYYTRVKDNFGTISADIFRALYRNRKKTLLKLAAPTNLIALVKSHYGDLVTDKETADLAEKPIIYINTYPYEFNSSESATFKYIIQKLIPKSNVKMIKLSNKELTPEWITDEIGVMFKYDALDWINYHTGTTNLIKKPLITVTLIGPAIMTGRMPGNKADKELFMNMMFTAGTLIDLSLIDTKYFCGTFDMK